MKNVTCKPAKFFGIVCFFLMAVIGCFFIHSDIAYAEDDADIGLYTSGADNGRSCIFNLVDYDNVIGESYNIHASYNEMGGDCAGLSTMAPRTFYVTSTPRTSNTRFAFSVVPGNYTTKLDQHGHYTILDLTCQMYVPPYLKQYGVGDSSLPDSIEADSSYHDYYPGGRFGAYDYNRYGCVGYANFQLPKHPDGAGVSNYTFHLQINIGNFRMNQGTYQNGVAQKTYQFRYNRVAFLYNIASCNINPAVNNYSKNASGYMIYNPTGQDTFQSLFNGTPATFSTPESLGIYKTGYTFCQWRSTVNHNEMYVPLTPYLLELFKDHASQTTTVVNVSADNPGQAWTGTNPQTTILQEIEPEWTPTTYNITYHLDGGTDPKNPATYNIETNSFTLKNPTKEGYEFTGWTGSNLATENKNVTVGRGTTGDLEFTANWKKKFQYYKITFSNCGGSKHNNVEGLSCEVEENHAWNDIAATKNSSKIVSQNLAYPPSKKGYSFIGWYFSNGTEFTGNELATTDTTVYATFDLIDYPITYHLNGGTDPKNPKTYNIETNSFTLKNPTKKGYNFIGWTGANGITPNKSVSIEQGTTGNLEFSANWEPIKYPITYDLKGGSDPENPATYTIETETFSLKNPIKEGYAFLGWTGSNGETPSDNVSIEQGSTGDLAFTANWKAVEYPITYYLNGGNNPENPATYTIETETFTLKNPIKEGYAFLGWTGSNGTTPNTNTTINKGTTGSLDFSANWTAIDYKIDYDLNGGTDPHNPIGYNTETPDFTLNNPTKEGYEFIGWTGSNGTTPSKTVTITKGSTGDKQFKANFVPKKYKITYKLDGGSNPKNPSTYTVNTPSFKLKNPKKNGYIFKGWTGSNGKKPKKAVTVKHGSTGNRTYKAIWEPKLTKMPYLKTTKLINKGSTFRFIVYGANKKGYHSVWKNSNNKVLSLSKKGIAKAKKNGTSVIGYKLYDKKGNLIYGFQIKIRVITTEFQTLNTSKKVKVKVPTFMFDKTLCIGKKFSLGFKNLEKDAKVTYKSSNPKILSVSKSGIAKSKKDGYAYVSITLKQHNLTYHYRVHFKCEKIEF